MGLAQEPHTDAQMMRLGLDRMPEAQRCTKDTTGCEASVQALSWSLGACHKCHRSQVSTLQDRPPVPL